jgi:hypothetical protein
MFKFYNFFLMARLLAARLLQTAAAELDPGVDREAIR